MSIWRVEVELDVKEIEASKYVFEFSSMEDFSRVLCQQPWNFHRSLLVLRRLVGSKRPNEVTITTAPFWVQVFGLLTT